MNDKELAEAMGWKYEKPYGTQSGPIFGKLPAGGGVWTKPDGSFTNRFDAFTSADDDYSVLEWMRGSDNSLQSESPDFIIFGNAVKHGRWYQIGDYARAALKVLDND